MQEQWVTLLSIRENDVCLRAISHIHVPKYFDFFENRIARPRLYCQCGSGKIRIWAILFSPISLKIVNYGCLLSSTRVVQKVLVHFEIMLRNVSFCYLRKIFLWGRAPDLMQSEVASSLARLYCHLQAGNG